jgi:hypothetical protein
MLINSNDYFKVLEGVKAAIQNAQYRAVLGVNREQILLFWNIGKVIIDSSSYGSKFIENLARDIKLAFPDAKGYSVRNLRYMRKLAELVPDEEKVQTVSAVLTWSHNKYLFDDGELDEKSNVQYLHIANSDKPVSFYTLDVILAVGYRVKSPQTTWFRQWATTVLHEYLQKGFAINDDFLKNMGGGLYWKELLERIRDIRASEKVMYRQVLDLYATSLDYNATMAETYKFFKIVQNKLHYAVSGCTASEIVFDRANASCHLWD